MHPAAGLHLEPHQQCGSRCSPCLRCNTSTMPARTMLHLRPALRSSALARRAHQTYRDSQLDLLLPLRQRSAHAVSRGAAMCCWLRSAARLSPTSKHSPSIIAACMFEPVEPLQASARKWSRRKPTSSTQTYPSAHRRASWRAQAACGGLRQAP